MEISMDDLRVSGDIPMIPRVPHGLAAAVEGLTREVMRHRPEDIFVFAAHHFEKLLQVRDQYGITMNLTGRNGSTRIIREMNRALKNGDVSKEGRSKRDLTVERGGWSLNETAKVLEKHRSIFGEDGRKINTDEVRILANEKKNRLLKEGRSGDRARSKENVKNLNMENMHRSSERFTRESPRDVEQAKCTNDVKCVKTVPKIMFQIPTLSRSTDMLAMDIKTELRKNRISSKERRYVNEKADTRLLERSDGDDARKTEIMKKSASGRSSRERSLEKREENVRDTRTKEKIRRKTEIRATEDQKQKKIENKPSEYSEKMPRTSSMNRVKDYVVRQFVSTKSLEEQQSPSYVEKTQKIIDETAPIIKEKVEKLQVEIDRLRFANGQSKNSYESVDELLTGTSERSNKLNRTDNTRTQSVVLRSKRYRRSNSEGRSITSGVDGKVDDSFEGIKTLVSELEMPKGEQENGDLKRPSEMENFSEVSLKSAESEQVRRSWSAKNVQRDGSLSMELDALDYSDVSKNGQTFNVSLPAVRVSSSKSASRNISRSDSNILVLPLISSETSKSAKRKAELILPTLPSSSTVSSTENCKVSSPSDVTNLTETSRQPGTPDLDCSLLEDTAKTELNLPDAVIEEVFKDSLNVTSDAIDVLLKPNFLQQEKDGGIDDGVVESKLNDMTKRDAEKIVVSKESAIENKVNKDQEYVGLPVEETIPKIEEISISEKLPEVGDTKTKIEVTLDIGTPKTAKVNIKKKLLELEDTERRIEGMFDSENMKIEEKVNIAGNEHNLKETEQEMKDMCNSVVTEVKSSRDSDLIKSRLVEVENVEKMIKNVLSYRNKQLQVENEIISNVENVLEEQINSATGLSLNDNENVDPKIEIKAIEYPLKEAAKHMEICKVDGETAVFETIGNVDLISKTENPSENKEKAIESVARNEGDSIDRFHLQTPSSSFETAPYYYILTEGSSYNIPDPMSTVIMPEKLLASSEFNTVDIVLENGVEVRSFLMPHKSKSPNILNSIKMKDEASSKIEKQITMKEQSLKNILHNFSKVIPSETVEYSTMDIDFIHGSKADHDLIVHQDLNQIEEEEDKELKEAKKMEVEAEETVKVGTLMLEDILESDENDEIDEKRTLEPGKVDDKLQMDSSEDRGLPKDHKSSKLVDSPPKITGSQKTDSTCTDEMKETSVSNDEIQSMISINNNSLEVEESTETRTSEMEASEMKETSITIHSVDDIAIFSFDLVKNASMPLIPNLYLDSLQDITMSFFRLTDENEEVENDVNQWNKEGTISLTDPLKSNDDKQKTGTDNEEVVEQPFVREQIEVKEKPCDKILAYITESDSRKDEGEPRENKNYIPVEVKIVTDILSEGGEFGLKLHEKNNVVPADPQALEEAKDGHRKEFGSNNDLCDSVNQEDLERNEIAEVNSLIELGFEDQQSRESENKDDLRDWEGFEENKIVGKASPTIKSEYGDQSSSENLSKTNEANDCSASIDQKVVKKTEEVEDEKEKKWKVLNTLETEFPMSREANEQLEGVDGNEEFSPLKAESIDVLDDDGTIRKNSTFNIAAAK